MTRFRMLLAAVLLAILVSIYWLELYQYFTLEFFRAQQVQIQGYVQDHLLLSLGMFFLIYVCVTAISLPFGIVMSLSAGALFGVALGTVVVSFASTLGATLAFLISRFLLQDYVDRHFPKATQLINEGISRDGPYYLFCLRLVPLFPYFVINLAMGLTHLPALRFAWVSQLGLLPITFILTNAGEQIASIESFGDVMSPGLMSSLILVGIFPLLAKKLLRLWERRKAA